MRRLGYCVIVAGALAGSMQLRADEALPGDVGTDIPVDEVVIDVPDAEVIPDDGLVPTDPGTGAPILIDDTQYEGGIAESGPPEGEVPVDDGTVLEDDPAVDDGSTGEDPTDESVVDDGSEEWVEEDDGEWVNDGEWVDGSEGEVVGEDGESGDGEAVGEDGEVIVVEDGDPVVDDGTVDDGTVVDGTVKDGVLYPGSGDGELIYTMTGGGVGGPMNGGSESAQEGANAPAASALTGSLSRPGLDDAASSERLPEGFPQPMDVIDSAVPQRKAASH
jgi:hypothetical protein